MTTRQLHDGFHGGNADMRRGFVSLKELKVLESLENVYIALHGHSHLYLETMPMLERSVVFRKELEKSVNFLLEIGVRTNIFVYPYDFTDCLSDKILHENGFHHIYPSEKQSRIYVEDILR
jgi:peptidoglycan/xylan/chitin deacetylase (PgdA/CDA1 family)